MSKATFYKYYKSKEELLLAVIDGFYNRFEQEIDALAADAALPVSDKIRLFVSLVRSKFNRLQSSAVEDVRLAVPEAYARIEERRKKVIIGNLGRLFRQGASEGLFRNDIAPELIALILLEALARMEHPQYMEESGLTFNQMFESVFSVVMEGSLSEAGRFQMQQSRRVEGV